MGEGANRAVDPATVHSIAYGDRPFPVHRIGRAEDVFLRLGPAEEPELRAGLPGVPLLQHLEVLEGHKRGGVARRLLTEAEQHLYTLGHRQVALGVSPDNEPAIALYRSLLFTLWRAQPLKTFREDLLDDGRIERVPELCLVFIKPLSRP
ncbi:GNAT family N-acetyltransferase [Actinoplanes flavus]|uniref:GNAT family N-acetyltransferase n=1 Tax=Actinoplanes flavus TaxID=2820290 RepID=A0ABS3UWZ5_9ACTN|nr:GNAT family N-acetyltransferase [Actinoplanes flavus]MBO3743098.1 GNAT family N-acetyltransferase [Actinoplanes flavus]